MICPSRSLICLFLLKDVGILRFVIVGGMFFVAVLAFIAGVLNAYVSNLGFGSSPIAAAAAFSFFLMVSSILCGVFSWMAGGGGTAS